LVLFVPPYPCSTPIICDVKGNSEFKILSLQIKSKNYL
jgi:hypothetical protein